MGGLERVAIGGAGLLGAGGVALAAYAAHASGLDARHAGILQRGIAMQIWHALALLGAARLAHRPDRWATAAIAGLLAGTILFCAAVDADAWGWDRIVFAAPVGGTILILSWLCMAGVALGRGRAR